MGSESFFSRTIGLFMCAFLFFFCGNLLAQHDTYATSTRYQFEQIVPVKIDTPPRPATRFGPGPEGWIKVRFTINADGSTSNVDVLDTMPSSLPTDSTIQTIKSWTFEPAIIKGTAVEWHNNIVTVTFDLPEIPNISGPQFTTPYNEVQQLLNENRLDPAARLANENLKTSTYSLHDIGLGNMQLGVVEMQRQDMHLAYRAITRATLPEVSQLSNEELNVALQYRFNIEISLGRYFDALESYNRRLNLVTLDTNHIMHEQAKQLQLALDQGLTLKSKARIIEKDSGWFFIPSRRTFTIADVDGRLDSIDVVCNMKIISLEYQPNVEWALPETWGDCSVTVMGNRNTTFSFYEFQE